MKTKILIISLSLLILIPFAVYAKSSITWNPKTVEQVIGLGGTSQVKVSFTSSEELNDVDLWIVPELEPFVTLDKAHFETVEENTPYDVNLTINVPYGTEAGLYDGSTHVRVGSKTYPDTLKIELNVEEPTDPDDVRYNIAAYLREGNVSEALNNFLTSNKSEQINYLDDSQRDQLAEWIERAELVREHSDYRVYRYSWNEPTGLNFIEFTMWKDSNGKWFISSI